MYFEKIETVEQALKVAEMAKNEGLLGLYPKALQLLADHVNSMKAQEDLFFVGYTNGAQVLYANDEQGAFYKDADHGCIIPLYMLKTHEHRLENEITGRLDFEKILDARKDS